MMYICIKIYIQGMKSFALKFLIKKKKKKNHLTWEKASEEWKKSNWANKNVARWKLTTLPQKLIVLFAPAQGTANPSLPPERSPARQMRAGTAALAALGQSLAGLHWKDVKHDSKESLRDFF